MSDVDLAPADELARTPAPLDWRPEQRALMVRACRAMAEWHMTHCAELRHLYERRDFRPSRLETDADLAAIPPIGVTAMKRYLITSRAHDAAVLVLTSSGTSGLKTQVWFDQASLDRVQEMMRGLWVDEGLVSEQPTNYVMFAYDPTDAKDLGIAFANRNLQRFAPVADSFYAIRMGADGNWEFRREATLARLKAAASEGRPVRMLGMPGFIHELIQSMTPADHLRLPPGSLMITGGGWKAAEDRRISRDEFRAQAVACFGLEDGNIRDNYGMAEHSAPYIECRAHRFHVPVYNRVIARDPVTMDALPPGETGLLELVTPFNAMMPTLALLTTDLGTVDAAPCACGRPAPTFTLTGRGGLSKHKGCALHASEIVRRRG
jgi:phenylacetate-coenzyme A ligase PaaK-like adenylate-forming protein